MIKVKYSSIIVNPQGEETLICYMDDGSCWRCNKNGENWEKIKLSDEELTVKFNESPSSTEPNS